MTLNLTFIHDDFELNILFMMTLNLTLILFMMTLNLTFIHDDFEFNIYSVRVCSEMTPYSLN